MVDGSDTSGTSDGGGLSVDTSSRADASDAADDWDGSEVDVSHYYDDAADDSSSDDGSGDADVDDYFDDAADDAAWDRQVAVADAQTQVDDAYAAPGAAESTPATIEEFNGRADAWASTLPAETTATDGTTAEQAPFEAPLPPKEVPFETPPAKEVEYQNPNGDHPDSSYTPDRADSAADGPTDASNIQALSEQSVIANAKGYLEVRQQSGEVLGGDPIGRADQWHEQGQNDLGYKNDCALASTGAVLRDCGVDASENDVVENAAATGRCDTSNLDPADNGGVAGGAEICDLMRDHGVASTVEHPADSAELADMVQQGRGVVAEVNSGELWDSSDPRDYGDGTVNHAVVVTGTTRDQDGQLTGFVVNDTGRPDGAGVVVPTEQWARCWESPSNWQSANGAHETVVTMRSTEVERGSRS